VLEHHLQGLGTFGLTRVELVGAGLSHAAVDRLYRGLYVYTIGFFDVMQVRAFCVVWWGVGWGGVV
jgi:hypothetical protein